MTPREFPVVVDRTSYFIPTVGIALLSSVVGAVAAMLVGMAAAGRGSEPPSDAAFFLWLASTFLGGGAWWVRRRWRIHHERKLIVDERGITYVRFAGRQRVMLWQDIREITEDEEWELGRWLTVRHRSRRFEIAGHTFHGYDEIRKLLRGSLPDRTRLRPG